MVTGIDSTEIFAERCYWKGCPAPRWEGHWCLNHLIVHWLLKYRVVRRLTGARAERGYSVHRWVSIRNDYVAFFSARAKGLLDGSVIPVSEPMEAIALAFSLHPRGTAHKKKVTFGHYLALIDFVWRFDHQIMKRLKKRREATIDPR